MSEIKTKNVAAQPDMKKKRKRNRGKKKPSTKSLINIPGWIQFYFNAKIIHLPNECEDYLQGCGAV